MTTTTPTSHDRLEHHEAWALLLPSGRGVLATAADGIADMFPVNYLLDGGTLLFRTAPGTKLEQVIAAPQIAFEVDGHDDLGYWSVVLRGTAAVLTDDVDVIGSGALELVAWAGGEKRTFVRLTPSAVEGRRVGRADLARSSLWG